MRACATGDVQLFGIEGRPGIGFDVPNRHDQDVDDEIDVDGEDEALFGAPQFTEQDVVAPPELNEINGALSDAGTDADVDVDMNGDAAASGATSGDGPEREPKRGKSLRDLVAEGKVIRQKVVEDAKLKMNEVMGVGDAEKVDLAVELARRAGDQAALIRALESKVQLLVSGCPHLLLPPSRLNGCLCRNPRRFHHRHHFSAVSVLTRTRSPLCRLAAGILAVVNAGCVAWAQPSCVLYARGSLAQRTCEEYTCRFVS